MLKARGRRVKYTSPLVLVNRIEVEREFWSVSGWCGSGDEGSGSRVSTELTNAQNHCVFIPLSVILTQRERMLEITTTE